MGRRSKTTISDQTIYGGDTYRDGLYNGIQIAAIQGTQGPWKIWVEEFDTALADGELDGCGWDVNDITAAGTESIAAPNHYLLLDPSATDDAIKECQFEATASGGAVNRLHKVMPAWTNTATLWDSRSLFFETRVGYYSDTTAWDGKALIGFFVAEDTIMVALDGLPAVPAGGGFGFHVGEDGAVGYLNTDAAITTAGTALSNSASWITAVVATPTWHTLGARIDITDASEKTGTTYFYYDGVLVDTVVNTTAQPFDATENYAFTICIGNGPARDNDLVVDYLITGCTRQGLTTGATSGF
jgi:hypothetical protein